MIQNYKLGEVVHINIDETVVSCIIIAIKNSYTLNHNEHLLLEIFGTDADVPTFSILQINPASLGYFGSHLSILQHCYQLLVGDRKIWYEPIDINDLPYF